MIYIGVDPKGVCQWKNQANQLTYYFYPDKENDSRKKAWLYAYIGCQLNIAPLLSHLFSNTDRPLPLTNTPEPDASIKNGLSIQAILEDPKKMLSITNSKALNGLAPKTVEKTQTVFQNLQDYYVLVLVRMNPEHRNKLPFWKQLECLLKNFVKFGKKIGEERLLTVQIIIGDFSTALSVEDVKDIKKALENLETHCKNRREEANPNNKSSLYKLINKLINGPVKDITNQLNGYLEKTTADSESTAQQTVVAAVDVAHKKIEEAQAREEQERNEKERERKEKEAAQAREQEANKRTEKIRQEKENERQEKEAAQAENERLKALLAKLQPAVVEEPRVQPQPAIVGENVQKGESEKNLIHENPELVKAKEQVHKQHSLAGSQETLFQAQATTSKTSTVATENPILLGRNYGS